MKKITTILVLATGLFLAALPSHAQTVTSIQLTDPPYIGTALAPTDVAGAGAYAVDNWNVVSPLGTNGLVYLNGVPQTYSASSGLVTSMNTPSTVGYSLTSGGAASNGNPGYTIPADYALLSGGASTAGAGNPNGWYSSPVTLTLNNLNAADTYSFIVYVAGSNYNLGEASVGLSSGGISYFTSTLGGFAASPQISLVSSPSSTDFSTTYASNPGGAASAYASNYLTFTGITGVTSETISLTSLGSWPGGTFEPTSAGTYVFSLSGVQVIDSSAAAVPEPSTVWLGVLGFLGLAVHLRRRQISQM